METDFRTKALYFLYDVEVCFYSLLSPFDTAGVQLSNILSQ